jgi:sirohydrochlorin ferrochelatase
MTGFVVFAHGSSVETANDAVRAVAAEAARRGGWESYETAFLGGGRPELPEAVAALAARGAAEVVVIPYFLTSGLHLERDLPALVVKIRLAHPSVTIRLTGPLDGHPGLVEAILDRAGSPAR